MKIGVVGGSIGGTLAATILRRDGHDVSVYERSSSGLSGRGAGLVAQQEVFAILRELGLEHVSQVGVVANERIFLDRSGAINQRLDTAQMQISWDNLFDTVRGLLPEETYRLASPVETVIASENSASVIFKDNHREDFDLVIGADGLGSVVRGVMNDRKRNSFAGYAAWRGLVPETLLPHSASELIGRFSFFLAPGIQVLGYLVPGRQGETETGKRRYNWVWYRPVTETDMDKTFTDTDGRVHRYSLARGQMSDIRVTQLKKDATSLLPPQFAAAITVEQTPSIQGIYDYEAQRMIGPRVALIGDAAFVVRPHTAAGVAKVAGDVLALRRALRQESDLPSALAVYERERLPVGRSIAALGRNLGEHALQRQR